MTLALSPPRKGGGGAAAAAADAAASMASRSHSPAASKVSISSSPRRGESPSKSIQVGAPPRATSNDAEDIVISAIEKALEDLPGDSETTTTLSPPPPSKEPQDIYSSRIDQPKSPVTVISSSSASDAMKKGDEDLLPVHPNALAREKEPLELYSPNATRETYDKQKSGVKVGGKAAKARARNRNKLRVTVQLRKSASDSEGTESTKSNTNNTGDHGECSVANTAEAMEGPSGACSWFLFGSCTREDRQDLYKTYASGVKEVCACDKRDNLDENTIGTITVETWDGPKGNDVSVQKQAQSNMEAPGTSKRRSSTSNSNNNSSKQEGAAAALEVSERSAKRSKRNPKESGKKTPGFWEALQIMCANEFHIDDTEEAIVTSIVVDGEEEDDIVVNESGHKFDILDNRMPRNILEYDNERHATHPLPETFDDSSRVSNFSDLTESTYATAEATEVAKVIEQLPPRTEMSPLGFQSMAYDGDNDSTSPKRKPSSSLTSNPQLLQPMADEDTDVSSHNLQPMSPPRGRDFRSTLPNINSGESEDLKTKENRGPVFRNGAEQLERQRVSSSSVGDAVLEDQSLPELPTDEASWSIPFPGLSPARSNGNSAFPLPMEWGGVKTIHASTNNNPRHTREVRPRERNLIWADNAGKVHRNAEVKVSENGPTMTTAPGSPAMSAFTATPTNAEWQTTTIKEDEVFGDAFFSMTPDGRDFLANGIGYSTDGEASRPKEFDASKSPRGVHEFFLQEEKPAAKAPSTASTAEEIMPLLDANELAKVRLLALEAMRPRRASIGSLNEYSSKSIAMAIYESQQRRAKEESNHDGYGVCEEKKEDESMDKAPPRNFDVETLWRGLAPLDLQLPRMTPEGGSPHTGIEIILRA